jgi:hypothetical protein
MTKVIVPEPVEPEMLYEFSAQERRYSKEGLEAQLTEIEQSLDKAYEKLCTDKYSILDYYIVIQKSGTQEVLGDYMSGGANLAVQQGRKHSLPWFQKRYKRSFQEAREKYQSPTPIDINVCVVGCKDYVPVEVETPIDVDALMKQDQQEE